MRNVDIPQVQCFSSLPNHMTERPFLVCVAAAPALPPGHDETYLMHDEMTCVQCIFYLHTKGAFYCTQYQYIVVDGKNRRRDHAYIMDGNFFPTFLRQKLSAAFTTHPCIHDRVCLADSAPRALPQGHHGRLRHHKGSCISYKTTTLFDSHPQSHLLHSVFMSIGSTSHLLLTTILNTNQPPQAGQAPFFAYFGFLNYSCRNHKI